MDANSKLGYIIVHKEQSQNGAVQAVIIERNALIVANSLPDKCHGLITKRRTIEGGVEGSVINFVIISADLVTDLSNVIRDEDKEHALPKITHKSYIVNTTTSNNNVMLTHFNLRLTEKDPIRRMEVLNFKNRKKHKKFRDETSKR